MINTLRCPIILCSIFVLHSAFLLGQWLQRPFPSNEDLNKVRFIDSTTGWISGANCFYKTTNGGQDWVTQDSGAFFGTLTPLSRDTVFLLKYTTVPILRRTIDGGMTWTTVDTLSTFYPFDIDFVDTHVGFASGGSLPGYRAQIRKTTDGGISWFTVWADTNKYYISGSHFFNSNHGWICLYNGDIMETFDSGVNWILRDTNHVIQTTPLRSIFFSSIDSGWAVGGLSGFSFVVRTTDAGSTWTYQSFYGSSLREVSFLNSRVGWFCGANNYHPFIAKTSDGGNNWITQYQIPVNVSGLESMSIINENLGWAVSSEGRVYKTTNGGVSFISGNPGDNPFKFKLYQNYPNPFNPSTTLSFDLSESGNIKLVVTNILGEELKMLDEGYKEAGEYSTVFNSESLPSGIYIYSLITKNQKMSNKMLLLR